MFGIGLGEIALALIVVFLIAPRELPRVLRGLGRYLGAAERIQKQWRQVERDVRGLVVTGNEEGNRDVPKEDKKVERPRQGS